MELEIVDSIDPETVEKALKRSDLKPRLTEYWCIPPKANAAFVCAVEDLLEVVHRVFDDDTVLLCIDETFSSRPGRPHAVDRRVSDNLPSSTTSTSATAPPAS